MTKKRDTARQTAAELIVRCLENEGVEYVFGIPGEENREVSDPDAYQKTIVFGTEILAPLRPSLFTELELPRHFGG